MKILRKRMLAVLLSVVMTATMLVALPTAAHAATDEVTIDIGNLNATTNNTGNALESQWEYSNTIRILYLLTSDGEYKLTGASTTGGLSVCVDPSSAAGVKITLDDVSITAPSTGGNALNVFVQAEFTEITLVGVNSITSSAGFHDGMLLTPTNVTIKGNGTLTATGAASGSGLGHIGTLNLRILESAKVTFVGGSGAQAIQPLSNPIVIGDNASLTMVNNSGSLETHSFKTEASNPNYMWRLTGDAALAGTSDPLTDNAIIVEIPAGMNGTVSRAPKVCEIVDGISFGVHLPFTSIDDALAVVANNQTIRLIADVTLTDDLYIDRGVTLTFDTNDKKLDFDEYNVYINSGSKVNFDGCDKFENLAFFVLESNGTRVEFDSSLDLQDGQLSVNTGAVAIVHGNLTAKYGVQAYGYVNVTIDGNVVSEEKGVEAMRGAEVTVGGSIDAGVVGVEASGYDSIVTVGGNVSAGLVGVLITPWDGFGGGSVVTVEGSISAGSIGVMAAECDDTVVTVGGSIEAGDSGVFVMGCDDSVVTVEGSIEAGYVGVLAFNYAEVFVNGNIEITKSGPASAGGIFVGVAAGLGAQVTVEGTISIADDQYVALCFEWDDTLFNGDGGWRYMVFGIADNTTTKGDYRQYDDSDYDVITSYVWVKEIPSPPVPGPATGDSDTLWLLLGALLVAALGTGCVLAYRRREQEVQ